MTIEFLIEMAWKSTLCAGSALLVIAVLDRRSAAEKSLIAYLGVVAIILLPGLSMLLPNLAVETPQAVSGAAQVLGAVRSTSASPSTMADATLPAPAGADWSGVLVLAYGVVALLLLAGLGAALIRLGRIRYRAELIADPRWLSALVAAQRRIGCKNGTALLVSGELDSPVSWGLLRPTIIIDSAAEQAISQAESIIAHELAHVVRFDWLRLILGRIALALFWFNPLVWMLVRKSHQLAEEAADDAVLRTDVASSDYADLLLHSVCHAQRSSLLAANGVAPSRSSLAQRIGHVLDSQRQRQSVGLVWATASIVAAASLNGVLAAATPSPPASVMPSTDPRAGEEAARQLEQLRTPQARALGVAIRLRNWNARRLNLNTTFNEPAAIAPLVRALADDNNEVRAIAVWGLSEMRPHPGAAAHRALRPLLGDPSPTVRAQAARALAEFESIQDAERIARLLGDPSPEVRVAAAHALGDLQLPATRTALEAARADPDPGVRSKVAWALGQVEDAERVLRRVSG